MGRKLEVEISEKHYERIQLIAKALGVDQNTAVRLILIKGLRE